MVTKCKSNNHKKRKNEIMIMLEVAQKSSITVITFGTFDLFHIGHLNILKRAAALGDCLVVGVSTDVLNYKKKGRYPICNQEQRKEIVQAIRYVNHVFDEESLENKRQYIIEYGADILVMGSDWQGKFDNLSDICSVVYVERTPSVSTTEIVELIKEGGQTQSCRP